MKRKGNASNAGLIAGGAGVAALGTAATSGAGGTTISTCYDDDTRYYCKFVRFFNMFKMLIFIVICIIVVGLLIYFFSRASFAKKSKR